MQVLELKVISEDFNLDFEFTGLNILIGANNSGKTFILKINFALVYILYVTCQLKKEFKNLEDETIENMIIETFRLTFDKIPEGEFGILIGNPKKKKNKKGGEEIIIDNEKRYSIAIRKQVDGTYKAFNNIKFNEINYKIGIPVFHSKELRLFTQKDMFLKMHSLISSSTPDEEKIYEQLLETYRLYDVVLMYRYINTCPFMITKKIIEKFDNFPMENGENFMTKYDKHLFDIRNNKFVIYNPDKPEEIINVSSLSAGQQALISMFINPYEVERIPPNP